MTTKTVLIVDDEPDIRELLDITLSRMGLDTSPRATLGEAEAKIASEQPDLCLTDMRLPDGNGISLVEHIQQEFPHIPVAMITAHGSVETAILALKAGAFDFISKPIELDTLRRLVSTALQLEGDTSKADSAVDQDLIGSGAGYPAAAQADIQAGPQPGAGAYPGRIRQRQGSGCTTDSQQRPQGGRGICRGQLWRDPPELMESELFGHIKGSFTGANQDKIGLFQAAAGGTLFLDEVADLPLAMQVKLLRAIQEKAVRPVGANAEQATDIRLLSATHKNLAAEVEAGRFRNDLYYRINVIDVYVPSLRERLEDLPELAEALLQRIAREEGNTDARLEAVGHRCPVQVQFPGQRARTGEHAGARPRAIGWRQHYCGRPAVLQHAARSTAIAATESRPGNMARSSGPEADCKRGLRRLEGYLEDIEREIIRKALEESRWNKTATAKLLGISFRSLRYRLEKLGLDD